MLVSPAEPDPRVKALGKSSPLPEQFGCDLLFAHKSKWYGVQRKELKDFIASVQDGRLALEAAQMQRTYQAIVVLEGDPKWTLDGLLVGKNFGAEWTIAQHQGMLWSLQLRGIWYINTRNVADTVETIQRFQAWVQKDKHSALERRPGPTSAWGHASNRDYMKHLVMGVPGIGSELAGRIVDKFGVPFVWAVSEEELMTVEGIGKKKVQNMMKALGEQ